MLRQMNEILCCSDIKLIITSAPAVHLILSFSVVSFNEAELNERTGVLLCVSHSVVNGD